MNAEQLTASILQLVVEGKLVEQLKVEGVVDQVGEAPEEAPFAIPNSWRWCRLKEVFSDITSGKNPVCEKRSAEGEEWGVIKTTAIQKGKFIECENKVLPSSFVFPIDCKISCGDFLMTKAGPRNRVGICCVVKELNRKLILSGHTVRLSLSRDLINPDFLVYVIHSPKIRQMFLAFMTGMAESQVNLRHSTLGELWIPLPPLKEQGRIVAKAEEVLKLVECYGKAYNRLQVLNTEFPDKLKASILQEAIYGKLVPQLASEGYQQLQEGIVNEVPYDVPETWRWAKLGLLLNKKPTNGRSEKANSTGDGYKILTLSATTKGWFDSTCFKFATLSTKLNPNWLLKNKDILIQRSNSPEYVGTACLYEGEDDEFIYPDLMIRIEVNETLALPEYVVLCLKSPMLRVYFQENATGTSKTMPKISQDTVVNALIPVPPLLEQRRIVQRVSELMEQVDALVA